MNRSSLHALNKNWNCGDFFGKDKGLGGIVRKACLRPQKYTPNLDAWAE